MRWVSLPNMRLGVENWELHQIHDRFMDSPVSNLKVEHPLQGVLTGSWDADDL